MKPNIPLFAIVLAIAISACAFVIFFEIRMIFNVSIHDSENDLRNWVSLTIEAGIGIFIAVMVLYYDKSQRNKIKKLQDKKREYCLHKIKLLLTLAKEKFQDEDYDDAKETFNEIISTLNIFSEILEASESQQILELSEIGKIFCKYNGDHPILPSRTMPFTTSIPANKAALFDKFEEVIQIISKK